MSAVGLATRKRTQARPGRATQRRGTSRPRGTQAPSAFAQWRTAVWASPTTSYYLVGGAVVLLLAIGLVMVLSASMVDSLNKTASSPGGPTPFRDFLDQLTFAAIGVPLAVVASRSRPEWYRRLAAAAPACAAAAPALGAPPCAPR